jgi:hypothetical protein
MALKTVVLWIHALCGVALVGVCGSFVLAAAALSAETKECHDFAVRSAPRIGRLCVVIACVIPLIGICNLVFAARARGATLPTEFVGILAAKIALFTAMAFAIRAASRAESAMRIGFPTGDDGDHETAGQIRRLMTLYGLTMAMGAIALALGLWLSGT